MKTARRRPAETILREFFPDVRPQPIQKGWKRRLGSRSEHMEDLARSLWCTPEPRARTAPTEGETTMTTACLNDRSHRPRRVPDLALAERLEDARPGVLFVSPDRGRGRMTRIERCS
jgi:hypothetical protein